MFRAIKHLYSKATAEAVLVDELFSVIDTTLNTIFKEYNFPKREDKRECNARWQLFVESTGFTGTEFFDDLLTDLRNLFSIESADTSNLIDRYKRVHEEIMRFSEQRQVFKSEKHHKIDSSINKLHETIEILKVGGDQWVLLVQPICSSLIECIIKLRAITTQIFDLQQTYLDNVQKEISSILCSENIGDMKNRLVELESAVLISSKALKDYVTSNRNLRESLLEHMKVLKSECQLLSKYSGGKLKSDINDTTIMGIKFPF